LADPHAVLPQAAYLTFCKREGYLTARQVVVIRSIPRTGVDKQKINARRFKLNQTE